MYLYFVYLHTNTRPRAHTHARNHIHALDPCRYSPSPIYAVLTWQRNNVWVRGRIVGVRSMYQVLHDSILIRMWTLLSIIMLVMAR